MKNNNKKPFQNKNLVDLENPNSLQYQNNENKKNGIDETMFMQKVCDHDIVIYMGDLNFRVDMKYEDCVEKVKENNLEEILKEDQFKKMPSLFNLIEGPIKFPPSYKFNKNSTEYTTKKMRTPSYCDRILFKENFIIPNQIKVLEYDYIPEVGVSDHKPVYCIMEIKIFEENSQRKENFQEQCSQKLKYLINDDEESNFNMAKLLEDKEIMQLYKLCEIECNRKKSAKSDISQEQRNILEKVENKESSSAEYKKGSTSTNDTNDSYLYTISNNITNK
jgi:hypothetical protein